MLWTTLWVVLLLTIFSVYGAFLGADRAKGFFNSLPLAVYWSVFLAVLAIGCATFKRLLRVPALLMIHAGCIAILIGGLWGSSKGQEIQEKLFGRNIIQTGHLLIVEGHQDNQVRIGEGSKDARIEKLPFMVALDKFRIEYYDPGKLYMGIPGTDQQWSMPAKANAKLDLGDQYGSVQVVRSFKNLSTQGKLIITQSGTTQQWSLPAEPNAQLDLGDSLGTVTVVRSYRNFRISMGGENGSQAYDDPGPGSNPAVEILLTSPGDTQPVKQYIFEQHPGHISPGSALAFNYTRTMGNSADETTQAFDGPDTESNPAVQILVTPPGGGSPFTRYIREEQPGYPMQNSPLAFQYKRMISDYISDVKIFDPNEPDKIKAQKSVEVNYPLYYGGYHLYQSSYGQDPRTGQMYSVFSVVSNSGLNWVFSGYLLICLGIAWQCWFSDIRHVLKQEAR